MKARTTDPLFTGFLRPKFPVSYCLLCSSSYAGPREKGPCGLLADTFLQSGPMDSEGETDVDIFTDAYQEYATMYSPLEHGYEHDHDDVGPPGYGSSDEYGTLSEEFCAAIVRIPLIILQSVAAALQELPDPPLAWMIAIGEKFPNTDLRKLRSKYPALLPAWLLQGFEFYQVWTYRSTHLLEWGLRRELSKTRECDGPPDLVCGGTTMTCQNKGVNRVVGFLEPSQNAFHRCTS